MRKRSKYRPKGVLLDTMTHVLSGVQRVGRISAGTTLMIKNHNALDALRRGEATRDDIDILIGALNTTEALARMRIGEDWQVEIRAAQDALLSVGRRGVETGKFILRGPELISLNLAMEVHDAQLEHCTVVQLEKALTIMENEYKAKKMRPIIVKEEHAD